MTKQYKLAQGRTVDEEVLQGGADECVFWGVDITSTDSNGFSLREEKGSAGRTFDLEERTARFGERIIQFCRQVPRSPTNDVLARQLARSGTSVGANYCEADDAVSKKDFKNKIGTCRKEAKETKYWLRMVAVSVSDLKPEARKLWQEARELHLIFCAIFNRS